MPTGGAPPAATSGIRRGCSLSAEASCETLDRARLVDGSVGSLLWIASRTGWVLGADLIDVRLRLRRKYVANVHARFLATLFRRVRASLVALGPSTTWPAWACSDEPPPELR